MVFLNLVGPVVGIQLGTLVKLVLPYKTVALGGIVGRLGGSLLRDADGLAGRARHDGDGARAGTGIRISRNRYRQCARLGSRILHVQLYKVLVGIGAPLFASGSDIDGVGAATGRRGDAGLRHGNADIRSRQRVVVVAPSAAPKGYGESEQECIKHEPFHLLCFLKDNFADLHFGTCR